MFLMLTEKSCPCFYKTGSVLIFCMILWFSMLSIRGGMLRLVPRWTGPSFRTFSPVLPHSHSVFTSVLSGRFWTCSASFSMLLLTSETPTTTFQHQHPLFMVTFWFKTRSTTAAVYFPFFGLVVLSLYFLTSILYSYKILGRCRTNNPAWLTFLMPQ